MDFAGVDRVDDLRVNVDAKNLGPGPRDYRSGGKSDVAEAQNDNLEFNVRHHPQRSIASGNAIRAGCLGIALPRRRLIFRMYGTDAALSSGQVLAIGLRAGVMIQGILA
jgi:hypothetical protein